MEPHSDSNYVTEWKTVISKKKDLYMSFLLSNWLGGVLET
jgi:hypothetical protein